LSSLSYGSLLLFFPALEIIRDKRNLDLVTVTFLLLLFYLGLDAMYQYHYGHDFLKSMPRGVFLSATGKDPLLGNLIAVFLPISFTLYYLLPDFLNKTERLGLYVLLTFPAYFFLSLSGRRIGWLSFAVAAAIYCWVRFGKLASVPIVLGVLALPFSGDPRMALNIITGDIRWKIWTAAYEVFQKHWLLGTGLDTFKQAQIKYKDVVFMGGKHVECTHNIYWGFLVDTGMVGLSIFLAFSIGCALYAFDTYKKISPMNPPLSHQIFCFMLSWLAFLMIAFAGIDFYATWMVGSPMVVLGAMMGACIMSRDLITRD
jgi:O-antigen ligase